MALPRLPSAIPSRGTGNIQAGAFTFLDPTTLVTGSITASNVSAGPNALTAIALTGAIRDAAGGNDFTGSPVTLGGNVSPGAGGVPQVGGIMQVNGDLTVLDNSQLTLRFGGTTPGETEANYEQLVVGGASGAQHTPADHHSQRRFHPIRRRHIHHHKQMMAPTPSSEPSAGFPRAPSFQTSSLAASTPPSLIRGDGNDAVIAVVPGIEPTTTVLAVNPFPSIVGQPVTLIATVSSGNGTPAGDVEFFDGTTSLGTAALDGSGEGQIVTTALPVGTRSLSASYLGDAGFDPSTSVPVNQTVNPQVINIAADQSALPEGTVGNTAFTFTLTRGAGGNVAAGSVYFVVSGSGADEATPASGTANIASGEATTTITINIATDLVVELDEDITVTLSNPSGELRHRQRRRHQYHHE